MSTRSDLEQRLAFLDLREEDLQRLSRLRPLLEREADRLVDAFYQHLIAFEPTRRFLRDPRVVERLLGEQRRYLLSLAGPKLDDDYFSERRRIGTVHEHIGLEPRWYLGAYALYLSLLTPLVMEVFRDESAEAEQCLVALHRLLMLDAQLAIETYIERREEDLGRVNDQLAEATRQLQRDYREQRHELDLTTRRARAAEQLASIGTLVAGLAHEIGTPMGVIQGHAKLLEKAVQGERAQWRLQTIQEQIARISGIIQSLLNMARPKPTERVPVDLEALLENTLAFLTEKFSRRGVRVERQFSRVPEVTGDSERLQQLCLNLFLNAVDAMPDGGVLTVSLSSEEDGAVGLGVRDDGAGIPASELDHIFDPFFTSKAAGHGNGLGLTVAHGIVADHGGTIEAVSQAGEGTEFSICLPAAGALSPGEKAG